jgi:hypothetical protein
MRQSNRFTFLAGSATMIGLQFGYGYSPSDLVIAFAGHGPSAAYGYSDHVWQKYRIGEFFDIKDEHGATIAANKWLKAKAAYNPSEGPDDENGMYQDASIEMLQKRGFWSSADSCRTEWEPPKLLPIISRI